MSEEPTSTDPGAKPPMRIFVFCDGTAQSAVRHREPTANTNVQRFKDCVPASEYVQHIYQSGAGTHAPGRSSFVNPAKIADKLYQMTGGGK